MGEVGKRWQEKGGKRKRKPQQVERRTGPLVSVSDPGTQQTTFRTHLWNDSIDRAHMEVIMSEGLSSLAETGLQGGGRAEEFEFLEIRMGRKGPCYVGGCSSGEEQENE